MTEKSHKKEATAIMLNWFYQINSGFVDANRQMLERLHPDRHVFIVAGKVVGSKKLGSDAEMQTTREAISNELKKKLTDQETFTKLVESLSNQFLSEEGAGGRAVRVVSMFKRFDATHLSDMLSRSMVVHHVEATNGGLIRIEQQPQEIRKD